MKRTNGRLILSDRNEVITTDLRTLVESGEIFKYSRAQLQERFRINSCTLNNRLDMIYAKYLIENVDAVRGRLCLLFDKLFTDVISLVENAQTDRDKRESIKLMLETIEKFTNFLEAFGIKERIPETITVGLEKQLILIKDSRVVDEVKDDRAV